MANAFTITNEASRIVITGGSLTNRATPEDVVTQLNTADAAQTDFVRVATKTYVLGKPLHIAGFFDSASSIFHCPNSNIIIARSGADWLDGESISGQPVLGSQHIISNITGPSAVDNIFNGVDIVQDQDCILRLNSVTYTLIDSVGTITLEKTSLVNGSSLSVTFEALSSPSIPNVRYRIPIAEASTTQVQAKFIRVAPRITSLASTLRAVENLDMITIFEAPIINVVINSATASIRGLTIYGVSTIMPIVAVGSVFGLVIRDLSGPGAMTLSVTPTSQFTGLRIDKTINISEMYPVNPNIAADTSGVAVSIIDSTDTSATPYNYGYAPTTAIPVMNNSFSQQVILQGVLEFAADGTPTQRLQPTITLRKFGYLESSITIPISTSALPQEHCSRLCVDDSIEVDLADTTGIFGVTVGNNTINVTPAFVGTISQFYSLVHAEYAQQENVNIPIGVRRFAQRYLFSAATSFIDNASIRGPGETIELLGDLTVSTTAMISAYLQYVHMTNGMSVSVSSFRTITDADDSIYYSVSSGVRNVVVNLSGPITSNLTVTLGIFNLTLAFGRVDNANVLLAPLNATYDLRIVKVDSAISVNTGTLPAEPFQLIPSYNVISSLGGLTLTQLNGFIAGRTGAWAISPSTIIGVDHLLTIHNAGPITAFNIALSIQNDVYNNPVNYTTHPFNYSGGLLDMPRIRVNFSGTTVLMDTSDRVNVHSFIYTTPFEAHITDSSGNSYLIVNTFNVNQRSLSYLLVNTDRNLEPSAVTTVVSGANGELSQIITIRANTNYVLTVVSPERRAQRVEFNSSESFLFNIELQNEPADITYSLDTEIFYDTSGMNAGIIKTSILSLVLADGPTETLVLELDGTSDQAIAFTQARKIFYDIKQSYNYLLYRSRNPSNDETIIIGENSITLSGLIIIRRDPAIVTVSSLEFEIALITQIDRDIVTPRAANNLRVEFVPAFGFDSGRSIAVDVASELSRKGVLTSRRYQEIRDV